LIGKERANLYLVRARIITFSRCDETAGQKYIAKEKASVVSASAGAFSLSSLTPARGLSSARQ
jgi:hypothetical protein